MVRVALGLLTLLLAFPTAAAWEARFVAAPAETSLTESLLLAGSVNATAAEGGFFGAPVVEKLSFDVPVDVVVCPDQAGEPQLDPNCPQAEPTTGARFYVHAGGFVARAPAGSLALVAPATAAALGGPNVTLNELVIGAGLYVGGAATVRAEGGALVVRPLLSEARIELRGDQGFRTYNGTSYTLHVTGFSEATLEARGAFVAAPELDVRLERAGLTRAEREIRVDELYETLRALQPPEKADRRSLLAGAFGLFQLVPALLDGAAAARTNLTLNDDARGEFTLVRLEEGRFAHDGANWTGSGNATYMLDGEELAVRPGAPSGLGWAIAIPIALVLAALCARWYTDRADPKRRLRYAAWAVRLGSFALLCLLVASTLAPLLGFSPVMDAFSLSLRSRVQLLLLVTGMVLTAYLAVGLASESLARSAFAWRERPRALVLPATVGFLAAFVFILFATPALLSFVARFVRL